LGVEDQLIVWDHLNDARKAFYLEAVRLREIVITTHQNLLANQPVWIKP
jgi:hypothetical protein